MFKPYRVPNRRLLGASNGFMAIAVLALVGLFFWGLTLVPALTKATAASTARDTQSYQPTKSSGSITDDQLKVFAQALDIVAEQYVEAKSIKNLVYGAVQGAVGSLDPHSSFMTPEEFKELQVETKGKFSGIGIEITLKNRILTVVSPI